MFSGCGRSGDLPTVGCLPLNQVLSMSFYVSKKLSTHSMRTSACPIHSNIVQIQTLVVLKRVLCGVLICCRQRQPFSLSLPTHNPTSATTDSLISLCISHTHTHTQNYTTTTVSTRASDGASAFLFSGPVWESGDALARCHCRPLDRGRPRPRRVCQALGCCSGQWLDSIIFHSPCLPSSPYDFVVFFCCPLSSVHPPFPLPPQPRSNFRLQATPKPVSGTNLINEVGTSPLYRADGKEVQFKDLYLPPKGSEGKEGANILIFLRHFG